MSNDEPTLYERGEVPQFGQDIKEPGEPFGEGTLDSIRTLIAEDDTKPGVAASPQNKAASHEEVDSEKRRSRSGGKMFVRSSAPEKDEDALEAVPSNNASEDEWHDWGHVPKRNSWRKIEIVEGAPGRALRRFLTTPRLMSILFLSGVVYWKPLFIPVLALVLVSIPLLIGALIGQDRMGRFVLRRLQRFVWKNPDLARLLEKVTPRRRRHLLHRPASEQDVWDGPIDPAFAERLSRIRY